MRGHMRMRNKGDMLDRIVILLLALAGLAERAARAPGPVRWLALLPLRRADAVASAFICGFASDAANRSLIAGHDHHGSDPADALSLALSLRMLALTLQAIIEQMRLSSEHPRSSDKNDRIVYRFIQTLGDAAWQQARLLDTS